MKSKVKCIHCDTQKTTWCANKCEHADKVKESTPKPKGIMPKAKPKSHLCKPLGKKPTPVINLTDDIEWPSSSEAADAHGITTSAIINCCAGRSWTAGGIRWAYKGGTRHKTGPLPERQNHKRGIYNTKSVRCIATGTIYPSGKAASRDMGMAKNTVYGHLARKADDLRGRKFEYVEVVECQGLQSE